MSKHQLACLYTKQKTQKRKVWKDGRLVLTSYSAILYDACPRIGSSDPTLDSCEVTPGQQQSILQCPGGQTLETENFLIEVEGLWMKTTTTATTTTTEQSSGTVPASSSSISSSIQKLLKSKFQKPKAFIPPQPGTQPTRLNSILGKRRRPLQPGELVRMHYGQYGVDGHDGSVVSTMAERMTHDSSLHHQRHSQLHQKLYLHQNSASVDQCSMLSTTTKCMSMSSYTDSSSCENAGGGDLQPTATPLIASSKQFITSTQQTHCTTNDGTQLQEKNMFAKNDFNANVFYGLEEDEGHGHEQQQQQQQEEMEMERSVQTTLSSRRRQEFVDPTLTGTYREYDVIVPETSYQQDHQDQNISARATSLDPNQPNQERPIMSSDDDSVSDDEDEKETTGPSSFRLSSTSMNPKYSSTTSKSNALSSDEMMELFGMTPDIVGWGNHI
jgi:hypothetical protein